MHTLPVHFVLFVSIVLFCVIITVIDMSSPQAYQDTPLPWWLLQTAGAGIMEANDRQMTTVFTVKPSFHD